jgi:hypothetical protein
LDTLILHLLDWPIYRRHVYQSEYLFTFQKRSSCRDSVARASITAYELRNVPARQYYLSGSDRQNTIIALQAGGRQDPPSA